MVLRGQDTGACRELVQLEAVPVCNVCVFRESLLLVPHLAESSLGWLELMISTGIRCGKKYWTSLVII